MSVHLCKVNLFNFSPLIVCFWTWQIAELFLCLYSQIGKGVHYNQNQGDGGTGGDQGETAIPLLITFCLMVKNDSFKKKMPLFLVMLFILVCTYGHCS